MALQRINHSTGFVLVQDDELEEWSFRVHPDGVVQILGNFGYVGVVPEVELNPPPNLGTVHTVAYTEFNDDVATGLRVLIDQHTERYSQCQLYVAGEAPRELVDWVSAGAPAPVVVLEDDEPEDEPVDEGPSQVDEVLKSGVLPGAEESIYETDHVTEPVFEGEVGEGPGEEVAEFDPTLADDNYTDVEDVAEAPPEEEL